jgi:hypothetical protein
MGRLYVEVVRPALAKLQRPRQRARARLGSPIREAILADLGARLPLGERPGCGRAAVISCRDRGIEAIDGRVAMDFLESGGWSVERARPHGEVAALVREGAIELTVAVTAGAEDFLRLAPVCTELRRLADPPVIILCDFSGRSHRRASGAPGADDIAHDPLELVQAAARRLPGAGQRRWGVRLSRRGGELVLAPTGCLDAISVGRLVDVAGTRTGTFSRLVIDLRDLAEIAPAGVRALGLWPDCMPGVDVKVIVDAGARSRVRWTGVSLPPEILERA